MIKSFQTRTILFENVSKNLNLMLFVVEKNFPFYSILYLFISFSRYKKLIYFLLLPLNKISFIFWLLSNFFSSFFNSLHDTRTLNSTIVFIRRCIWCHFPFDASTKFTQIGGNFVLIKHFNRHYLKTQSKSTTSTNNEVLNFYFEMKKKKTYCQ